MPIDSERVPSWFGGEAPSLLGRAAAVLAREALRVPAAPLALLAERQRRSAPGAATSGGGREPAGRTCPVSGAAAAPSVGVGAGETDLRRQAHELLAALFSWLGQGAAGGPAPPAGLPPALAAYAGRSCPATGATLPLGGFDLDGLRRQAHGLIETLLITFNQSTGEKGLPAEDQVPLIRCLAPVPAGGRARATLHVANEEATPSEISLYSTNFVAGAGYEIPSVRVAAQPRYVSIPANGVAAFEITIAVPEQTPAGVYTGLLQVAGSSYVKAALSVEVL